MENFNEQVEKQGLIININLMREKIGVSKHSFEWLWSKDVEWLRNEQESTISHYNEALRNTQ